MRSRAVYRAGPAIFLLAALLVGGGGYAVGSEAWHLSTGTPEWTGSLYSSRSHLATKADQEFSIAEFSFLPLCGLLLLLVGVNSRVVLEPEGVVVYGAFGQKRLAAPYDSIQKVGSGSNKALCLHAGSQSVPLPMLGERDRFLSDLRARAPQLLDSSS